MAGCELSHHSLYQMKCFYRCTSTIRPDDLAERHSVHKKCIKNYNFVICFSGFKRLFELETHIEDLFGGICN